MDLIPKKEFDRILSAKKSGDIPEEKSLQLFADMCRINTLCMVVEAGSGHIGTSFSSMDILSFLYLYLMNHDPDNPLVQSRDKLILSKGHAVPAQYSILAALGYYSVSTLLDFRKLGGLQGHPDVRNSGIDGNTGSLGMGISKAKGYLFADRIDRLDTKAFVIVGDGELAEGQNWEAIQSAAYYKLDNLTVIIDKNRFQTESPVDEILVIGDISAKFSVFGWDVVNVDGHDFHNMLQVLPDFINKNNRKPKAVVIDTVKGKGVPFMEAGNAYIGTGVPYMWHGKCPNNDEFVKAIDDIYKRLDSASAKFAIPKIIRSNTPLPKPASPCQTAARVTEGFEEKLLELSDEFSDIVVLDADLERESLLCEFHRKYPERFFQMGIAEQDMVSTAGGMALAGKIPVVSSYAAFLTARSVEHIFNNSSENTHIVYLGHMAGLIPAKPGKSHIGIRDIANLKTIPNMLMIEPVNAWEAGKAFEYLIRKHQGPGYLRLRQFGAKSEIKLPDDYELTSGEGIVIKNGNEVVFFVSCPFLTENVMMAEVIIRAKTGISAKIIHMPWLNKISAGYIKDVTKNCNLAVSVENHCINGGVGDEIACFISSNKNDLLYLKIGIKEFAESGANDAIMKHFGLDADSIAEKTLLYLN